MISVGDIEEIKGVQVRVHSDFSQFDRVCTFGNFCIIFNMHINNLGTLSEQNNMINQNFILGNIQNEFSKKKLRTDC